MSAPTISSIDNGTGGGTATKVTATLAPPAGAIVYVFTTSSGGLATPSIAGLGITWTGPTVTSPTTTLRTDMFWGRSVGNTGTITITWNASPAATLYEVIQATGTMVVHCAAAATNALNQTSPNTRTVALLGGSNVGLIFGSSLQTPTSVTPTFTLDTDVTWTLGHTNTQGTTPPYSMSTGYTTNVDTDVDATWTWGGGGNAHPTLIAVSVADVGAALVGLPVRLPVQNQYTVGLGGWAPSRALRVGSFDMLLGAAVPNASGSATLGSGRDDALGDPSTPGVRIRGLGLLGPFDWPADAGARSLSARVYYTPDDGAAYRPQLIVRANSQAGVQSDLVSTAPAGADAWLDFPTLAFTVATPAVLQIYLKTRNARLDGAGPVGSGSPPVFAVFDSLDPT